MNIFIDTTCTFQDPFFKNINNRILFNLLDEFGGCIYISNVVLEETKVKLKKNIEETLSGIQKNINDYNKISLNNIELNIDYNIEKYINELDNFYNELSDEGKLEILEYKNEILPKVIDRAINRIKPFSEGKDEFRDAVIWLTYSEYINEEELEECYFITNNTKDYYDKDSKDLHDDLKADCKNIKLVKSSKELIKLICSKNSIDKEHVGNIVILEEWIKSNKVNENLLLDVFNEEFNDKIYQFILEFLLNGNIPMNTRELVDHYELDTFYIKGIEDISYEIIEEEIYITGIMKVKVEADRKLYNSVRESRDEECYFSNGTANIILELEFTLLHEGEKGAKDLQIDKVWKFEEDDLL